MRMYAQISKEDLEEKLQQACDKHGDIEGFLLEDRIIAKDLKVSFDLENLDRDPQLKTTDGPTFITFQAGGDWEFPVVFIIYWDGSKLRAHIPTKGNVWDRKTKSAFYCEVYNGPARDYTKIAKDIQGHFEPIPEPEEKKAMCEDLLITQMLISVGYVEEQSSTLMPVQHVTGYKTAQEMVEAFILELRRVFEEDLKPAKHYSECKRVLGSRREETLGELFRGRLFGESMDSLGGLFSEVGDDKWEFNGVITQGRTIVVYNFDNLLEESALDLTEIEEITVEVRGSR